MPDSIRPRAGGLVVAIAAPIVALVLRLLLDPLLDDFIPYATFFVAVVVAAWAGGFRSALIATAIGLLASWFFFVPPRYSLELPSGPHLIGLVMYVIAGVAIAAIGEGMHAARRRYEDLADQRHPVSLLTRQHVDRMLRKRGPSDLVVIGFVLTVALIGAGGLLGHLNTGRLTSDRRVVTRTHEALRELEVLFSAVKDAETGQRGYLLTSDPSYLQPYEDAMARVQQHFVRVGELLGAEMVRQGRIADLRRLVDTKLEELQRTVAAAKAGDRDGAMQIVTTGAGKDLMDRLRAAVSEIERNELELLNQREVAAESSAATIVASNALTASIGLALVTGVFVLSLRHSQQRRRAALIVAEQAERLRTTLTSIGDAVITTDLAGRVTNLNPIAEAMTGWTNEDARGQPLDTVFHIVNEDTRQPVANPAHRALREGVIVGLANHTILIAKDGTERPIDDSAAPIRCAEKEVVGCVLVFRDVSERRAHDRALVRSEARSRAVIGTALDCVLTMDHEGRIVEFNPACERTFGYRQADVIGKRMDELLVPARLRDQHRQGVARYLRSGEPRILDRRLELTAQRAGGAEFPVELAITRIPDEPPMFTAYMRDITDRRRSERVLQEAREFAESIVDTVREPLLVLDYEQRVRSASRSFCVTFRTSREEVEGKLLHELGGGQWNIPELRRLLADIVEKGSSVEDFQIEHDFPGIGHRTMLVSARRVYREGNHTDSILIAFEDVTEQKRLETDLRRAVADLATNDRRKDEFLATLAHELRNPLAPLSNMLAVMRRAAHDPELVTQCRETMERQVGQLVRLVDDLLDIGRITRDALGLRIERCNLASVVQHAVETARPMIDAAGQELHVALPPNPVWVLADPARLAQAFGNLLGNACKFSEARGRIDFSVERRDRDVWIRVRDGGIGIPADKLESIFGMFSQIDRSRERSRGGLGIGLALVRRLVEMHGGAVEAISGGEGRGSEFVVRLPIATDEPATPPPVRGSAPAPGARRRVVVVDDNVDAATSLAILLEAMGNEAHVVHDGVEALRIVERVRPDVVMLDIGLPRMNGYDVCRRIREQDWGRVLRMIALTGWGQEDDRRLSVEAGFDHHVVKPVDVNVLVDLLAAK